MRLKTVLLVLYLVLFAQIYGQTSQSAVIDRINTKELNNSFVSALFEDKKGYLWVGTIAGLNRYDGYEFTKFRSIQKDSGTLSNPAISCIQQLDNDRIIVGTRNGLNIYSYKTNKFTRVALEPGLKNPEKKQNIYSIVLSESGGNIIGTADGLLSFDANSNTLKTIPHNNSNFLSDWVIQSLCFDRLGNLWAGAKRMDEKGNLLPRVFKCNINKRKITEITAYQGGSSGHIGISEDYLGNIWVAGDDGLININPATLAQTFYKAPENFYSNISYTHTKDNTIWQCYWSFGLTAFDIDKKEFKIYRNDPENPKSLMSNKCWALYKDVNDILWIGTDIGLQKLTSSRPDMQTITRNYQNSNNTFPVNRISAVLPSNTRNNIVYVGTDGEGFSIYDRQNKTSINFGPNVNNKTDERFVNKFYEDEKGNVYIAGQYHFHKISWTGNTPFVKSFFSGQEHFCATIVPDPANKNMLWIGGKNELIGFDTQTQQFTFLKDDEYPKGIFNSGFVFNKQIYFTSFNEIICLNTTTKKTESIKIADVGNMNNSIILNDSTVLISSQFLGLIKFYPKTSAYEVVYRNNDQLFPEIKNLLYYKNFVWLATNNGLIKWSPVTKEYSEITADDGLPSETINHVDVLEGYLFIATQAGLVIFNPDFQVSHFNIPNVEITSIKGSGNNFLKENIINGSEIILKEDENSFQVSFTVFDFNMPEKNSYKFKLLPQDKEWTNIGNRHTVYFNDLSPGTYVFELMGANADNIWCAEPYRVTIKIVPPFYKSRWFYFLSIGLVLLGSVLFVIFRFRSNQLRQKRLEEIISHRTAEIREKRAELLDSISYAERIQKAIFVGEDILTANLKESFILYKPKDKISGDFYWIGRYKDHLIVFAGDCTGHGVPGAMLSIVGTSLLNKIVFEENIYLAGEILTRLNNLFYNQMNLKESNIRDGMDASVITLNLTDKTVYYSGAKNDACYINNEIVFDLKAERHSIGENNNVKFATHILPYEPNRCFYLFSDGVKDQFGGPKQKKLSSKRFKQVLLKAASLPVNEQQQYILDFVNDWKAGLPQTDDILVIGLKL